MPKVTSETFADFSGGIISALQPDSLPPNAYPRGWNSAFYNLGPGSVSCVGTRRGARVLNTTPITGSPAILENFQYKRLNAGVYTLYHLLVSSGGRLDALDPSTFTTAAADASAATPFTAGTLYPDFEVANNLAFIVNGTDAKKFNGTNVQNFGLAAPIAPVLTTSATGQTATDDVATTYYNANTGLESSRSPFTTQVLANQKMVVTWVASADTQVTHVRVYYRRPVIGTTFVLAATVAVGTLTTTLNLADADINVLVTAAPDTAQNNPPPVGIKYLTWHYSRMFAADDTQVYYSNLGQPEAFDPNNFLRVNINDGQKIIAIHSAQEILFIFKERSIWALSGTDPQSWQLRILVPDMGATSHRSVFTVEGVTYWWSPQGAARIVGLGAPALIALPFLGDDVGPTNVAVGELWHVCGQVDRTNQRIQWALPGIGKTRNTFMLPFNYRSQCWESNKWDSMDVSSLGAVEDTNGRVYVHIGNYVGRVFRWWDADTDGARVNNGSGTTFTLNGSLLGSTFTSTILTDSAATFDTTGAGLANIYMTVVNAADSTDVQRVRIASNTGTAITIDTSGGEPSLVNMVATQTYRYFIGGPDFQFASRWSDGGADWIKKRYEFLYIALLGLSPLVSVDIDFAFNFMAVSRTVRTTFPGDSSPPVWDVSLWDGVLWAGAAMQTNQRIRVGHTGMNWQVTLRHRMPNQPVFLTGLGMRAVMQTDKIG